MNRKSLQKLIDKALLKLYINDTDDMAAEEYAMQKREKILKKHTSSVYPIKMTVKGGRTLYYTKLDPANRNNNHAIYAVQKEDLEDKIVAYYLGVEMTNKLTVKIVLELAIADLTDDTAKRHRQLFNKHFSEFKNTKMSRLSENDIRTALQNIIDDGIKAKAFNNATSTLNKINDYCAYNHIDCINMRKVISEFRKYKLVGKHVFLSDNKVDTELAFNEAEAISIIKYALDNPDYHNLALAALILTGLRAGELLALTPEDVNLTTMRIRVNKMEKTKSFKIVDYCKDNSDRYVYLNDDAMQIFRILMEKRSHEETDCPYLILNHMALGDKMHLGPLDKRIRRLQPILGFAPENGIRSCHDCRRTYASIQYLHEVDIKTIQAQLGHSTQQQTWDYIKDVIDTESRLQTLSKGCILA